MSNWRKMKLILLYSHVIDDCVYMGIHKESWEVRYRFAYWFSHYVSYDSMLLFHVISGVRLERNSCGRLNFFEVYHGAWLLKKWHDERKKFWQSFSRFICLLTTISLFTVMRYYNLLYHENLLLNLICVESNRLNVCKFE